MLADSCAGAERLHQAAAMSSSVAQFLALISLAVKLSALLEKYATVAEEHRPSVYTRGQGKIMRPCSAENMQRLDTGCSMYCRLPQLLVW